MGTGMVTHIVADAVITTVGEEGAVTITDGTEVTVTDVTGKPSLFRFCHPLPGQKANGGDANGRA